MSGDIKAPVVGKKAPLPDDGTYLVKDVDKSSWTILIEWSVKGFTYQCWVPESEFTPVTEQ